MDTDYEPMHDPRLRQRPVERGIGTSQIVDIAAALQQLRAEPHPSVHGHRQVTVFHQTPLTIVLIAFDPNGMVPNHVAHGTVTIQVIEGSLIVQVEDTEHVVEHNQILVLNPDISHSVRAQTTSVMLLTVQLVGEKAIPHQG